MTSAAGAAAPYVLLSSIDLPPGALREGRARLLDFVGYTRAEPGCLAFELHEEEGERARAGRFMLYEVFRDDAAFEAHRRSPALGPLKEWLQAQGAVVTNRRHRMLSPWRLQTGVRPPERD